jgi:hypothetical protein
MVLIATRADGTDVLPGDTIWSFRGEPATYMLPTHAASPGHSGKVLVAWFKDNDGTHPARTVECYDKVFDLTVHEASA